VLFAQYLDCHCHIKFVDFVVMMIVVDIAMNFYMYHSLVHRMILLFFRFSITLLSTCLHYRSILCSHGLICNRNLLVIHSAGSSVEARVDGLAISCIAWLWLFSLSFYHIVIFYVEPPIGLPFDCAPASKNLNFGIAHCHFSSKLLLVLLGYGVQGAIG